MLISGIALVFCGCASHNTKLTAVHIESPQGHSVTVDGVHTCATRDGALLVSGVVVKNPGHLTPKNNGVEILAFDEQGRFLTNTTTTYFPSQLANNRPEAEGRAVFFASLAANPNLVRTVCILTPLQEQTLKR